MSPFINTFNLTKKCKFSKSELVLNYVIKYWCCVNTKSFTAHIVHNTWNRYFTITTHINDVKLEKKRTLQLQTETNTKSKDLKAED